MRKIEEIESQIKDLFKEVERLKKQETKFEVGKWYKCPNDNFMVNCQYPNVPYNNCTFGYGFGALKGDWHDSLAKDESLIPATPQEVETALIAEAKKRGFKEGVKVKAFNQTLVIPKRSDCELDNKNKWFVSTFNTLNDCALWASCNDGGNNAVIFHDGIWAEIIKEDKIMIGGYEVLFTEPKCVKEQPYTKIDSNVFSKSFWVCAREISEHSKAKIMVGCSKQFDVSLETINKILSRL